MKWKILFLFLLTIILESCAGIPQDEFCTKAYLNPGYAYTHSEDKRFEQTRNRCEPEYKLDRAEFHKAYVQGEHNQRVGILKSYCSCEVGYSTAFHDRDKNFFNLAEIQKDPLYACDNENGKSEFERGLSLGKKYGQYVEENKWSFKPIYHPDDAAIKKSCMK